MRCVYLHADSATAVLFLSSSQKHCPPFRFQSLQIDFLLAQKRTQCFDLPVFVAFSISSCPECHFHGHQDTKNIIQRSVGSSPTSSPHHHQHQSFPSKLCRSCSSPVANDSKGISEMRNRRLRSWVKHERQSIAMALAEALHQFSRLKKQEKEEELVEQKVAREHASAMFNGGEKQRSSDVYGESTSGGMLGGGERHPSMQWMNHTFLGFGYVKSAGTYAQF